MTFVTAFDLATATGVADGNAGDAKPRLWTWHLDDDGPQIERRLGLLLRYLNAYFDKFKPDVVIYEKPLGIAVIGHMMAKNKFLTSEDTLAILRGSIGVLIARAATAGVPEIRGMDIKDARKHLCGQRTFPDGEAKAATMRAATSLRWDPQNDNESDAAALWSLSCGQANPRLAAALGRAHLAAKDLPKSTPKKDRGPGPLFKAGERL